LSLQVEFIVYREKGLRRSRMILIRTKRGPLAADRRWIELIVSSSGKKILWESGNYSGSGKSEK
jgi:hypothetical protein